MKTIEEKARVARERVINDLRRAYEKHGDIQHYVIATTCIEKHAIDLYKQGASEALAGQWRSVEDNESLEDGTDVIIRYNGTDPTGKRGVFMCVIKYYHQTGFAYLEEILKCFDVDIFAWMPIPEPPKPDGHA